VLSTEEIVVKPLASRLKSLGTYSGATILGDGRVALILDAALGESGALTADALERSTADASAAHHRSGLEGIRMLVAGIGSGRRVAIPLSSVTRLENINASSVEVVGSREVVQYRGAILPLLRLDRYLGAISERPGDDLVVVVYSAGSRSVVLAVDEIVDIVEEETGVQSDIDDHGLLGSALIRDRIVEVLDVRAAILAADPKFYDALETEMVDHDELRAAV